MRLPSLYRKSLKSFHDKRKVLRIMREGGLSTVCEEARCPNIGECFKDSTATFMIMGDRCTRRCHFCSVTTKKPLPLDENEPEKVALACEKMGLKYVVITSVDRDELFDFGAQHFLKTIEAIKKRLPFCKIEILTSDFRGDQSCLDLVLSAPLDVFSHNIETVPRLYKSLRPQSNFITTLNVLKYAVKKIDKVKTGMMVGLGESDEEVFLNLRLIKSLGVKMVNIGQYLRPSLKHWPVVRYVNEETFLQYKTYGERLGLKILAGPFVRSSYHAHKSFYDMN